MSKRGTIFLAVGLLILGLIIGAVAGGVTGRFLARRSAFGALSMRMAPRGAYFGAHGFGRGMTPFYAPGGGFGAAPFYGQGRGFGRAPFKARPRIARRALRASFANGARVAGVESNSPADAAGLKAGDVITTVADTKIDAQHSFASLLHSHKPGDKIDLGVRRAGQSMTVSATLGASPQNSNTAYLGVRYGPAPGPREQPRRKFR